MIRQGLRIRMPALLRRPYMHLSARTVSGRKVSSHPIGGVKVGFHPSQCRGHSQATSEPGRQMRGSMIVKNIPVTFWEMARCAMSDGLGAPKTWCHEHQDLHSCKDQTQTCRRCTRASSMRALTRVRVLGDKASHVGRQARKAGLKRPQSREISEVEEHHHSISKACRDASRGVASPTPEVSCPCWPWMPAAPATRLQEL